jgi:hypothetical protein
MKIMLICCVNLADVFFFNTWTCFWTVVLDGIDGDRSSRKKSFGNPCSINRTFLLFRQSTTYPLRISCFFIDLLKEKLNSNILHDASLSEKWTLSCVFLIFHIWCLMYTILQSWGHVIMMHYFSPCNFTEDWKNGCISFKIIRHAFLLNSLTIYWK